MGLLVRLGRAAVLGVVVVCGGPVGNIDVVRAVSGSVGRGGMVLLGKVDFGRE